MTAHPPRTAFLHVTQHCNLRCAHCQYLLQDRDHFRPRNMEDWQSVLKHFASVGMSWCTVSAEGEPLLHPEYDAILAGLTEHGIKASGVTNGLLLHKHLDAVVKHLEGLTVSLDAPDAETYGAIRGKAEAYPTVLENIRLLVEHKRVRRPGFRVSVKFDMHAGNLHLMERMIRKGLELEADAVHFGTINDEGTGSLRPLFDHDKDIVAFLDGLRRQFPDAPVVWPSLVDMEHVGRCAMLFEGLVVNSDHALSPCCHLPGNADEYGLWHTPAQGLERFRRAFSTARSVEELPEQCRHCHRRMWS